jgi:hypothetical protein
MSAGSPNDDSVRRMLALGVWGGLGAVAVVLVGRSATGELDVAIGPVMSCVLATLAAALSLYAWWQDHLARGADDPFACALRGMTALAAPAVIGLVLVRDSAAALTYLLAIGVIAVVAVCDRSLITRRRAMSSASDRAEGQGISSRPGAASSPSVLPGTQDEQLIEAAAPLDDPAVSQAVTRRTTADSDSLEALLRVRFDPGQREVALHIPIWPAMAANPEVECEPLDASNVELRVSSAHTYGVRLEARRPADQAQQPGEVPVGVTITAPPTASAAEESPDIRPLSA